MGWLFCLGMIIGYAFNGNLVWLLTAGLFAISGGLSEVGSAIRKIFIEEVDLNEIKD